MDRKTANYRKQVPQFCLTCLYSERFALGFMARCTFIDEDPPEFSENDPKSDDPRCRRCDYWELDPQVEHAYSETVKAQEE